MFNYYIYRSYFNARHSFNGDRENMHGHSFTLVTYIGMKDKSEDIPFFKLEAIVAKCKEAGVILTGAGATFPYHNDPKDSNIRIAPSFPTPEEMQQATEIFVLCVKLVSVQKLLEV